MVGLGLEHPGNLRIASPVSASATPGIMVPALVAGLISGNIELALTLLVIGCPGALVISMPVLIVAGYRPSNSRRHPDARRRAPVGPAGLRSSNGRGNV